MPARSVLSESQTYHLLYLLQQGNQAPDMLPTRTHMIVLGDFSAPFTLIVSFDAISLLEYISLFATSWSIRDRILTSLKECLTIIYVKCKMTVERRDAF